eukprot:Gb_13680 [translate_table: standard]
MAGLLDPTHLGITTSGTPASAHGKLEEPDHSSSNWYFTREEIEKNSPSRKDGIDLKKETYFRKSYCTFLQDLGMRLKVPQVTIATAIIFCHRFFHRQSHAKNDKHTIATVCMFLAGKVEETPRPLRDVILVSYEICNKKDPAAIQRIKQKEVYEQQKELVLLGERVVLASLGFDLNVHHPYKPLVAAIKKFKVAQNALAQVAWNFVNDGLRTSLCLQFKPHHIAAGAIFLAAKFLKVKLPSDGEVVWWQEFEVTPLQLEEVSNQMLELYEQNRAAPASRGSELGGSSGANNHQKMGNSPSTGEGPPSSSDHPQVPLSSSPAAVQTASRVDGSHDDANNSGKYVASALHGKQNEASVSTDYEQAYSAKENVRNSQPGGSTITKQDIKDHLKDAELNEGLQQDLDLTANNRGRAKVDGASNVYKLNKVKHPDDSALGTPQGYERKEPMGSRRAVEEREEDDKSGDESRDMLGSEDIEGKKSWVGLDDVDKDKVKAALEKRRKFRGEGMDSRPTKPKVDLIDEDDLIERELESGVEAAAEAEKAKQERKENWPRSLYRAEQEGSDLRREQRDEGENGRKRKRPILESLSDKRRARSSDHDPAEGNPERISGEVLYDRTEEGELPDTSMHEQVRSPRVAERRSPMSNQLDKGGSPAKRRDYAGRDPQGHRDGSHDKHRHGNYHHHHSSYQQQHQHRADAERDRHHYKDRDKQEREHKKTKHDYGK